MCPAKVITPNGNIFFVDKNKDIHQVPEYEGLPLEDKKYLALCSVESTKYGFLVTSDFQQTISVTPFWKLPLPAPPGSGAKWEKRDNVSILVLPMDTRIEPVREHPSLREK